MDTLTQTPDHDVLRWMGIGEVYETKSDPTSTALSESLDRRSIWDMPETLQ